MTEFTQSISSSNWWLSVVFAGILINLTTAALVKFVPISFSRMIKSWQNRSEKAAASRAKRVEAIAASTENLLIASIEVLSKRTEAIQAHVAAIIILGLSPPLQEINNDLLFISLAAFLTAMLIGLYLIIECGKMSILVLDARLLRAERTIQPSTPPEQV